MTADPSDTGADTGIRREAARGALAEDAWHGLPRAAGGVFAASGALGLAGPGVGAAVPLGLLVLRDAPLAFALGWGACLVLLALLFGAWLGFRRWRATEWMLDRDGLHMRRGIWWRSETLVPRSRVQHLDLERGPLERHFDLATLVVHTAGTRMASVRLPGLQATQATALRDLLVADNADDNDAV